LLLRFFKVGFKKDSPQSFGLLLPLICFGRARNKIKVISSVILSRRKNDVLSDLEVATPMSA
jgi:hypothetical protein